MNTSLITKQNLSTTECTKRGNTFLPVEWVKSLREAHFHLCSVLWGVNTPELSKRDRKTIMKAMNVLGRLDSDESVDDPFS